MADNIRECRQVETFGWAKLSTKSFGIRTTDRSQLSFLLFELFIQFAYSCVVGERSDTNIVSRGLGGINKNIVEDRC